MAIPSLNKLSYGMYVACTKKENKLVGCIINSCIQVTSENPTVVLSLNKNNFTTSALTLGTTLSLNILGENSPRDIIGTFGFSSSKNVNKFENTNYTLENGIPILTETCGYLILKVINMVSCGTHNLILCEVLSGKELSNDNPMTYSYYHTVIKGKAPKNSPTYINEEDLQNLNVFKCPICGYEYTANNPKFEDLPDSWVCPICGVPKSVFIKKNI